MAGSLIPRQLIWGSNIAAGHTPLLNRLRSLWMPGSQDSCFSSQQQPGQTGPQLCKIKKIPPGLILAAAEFTISQHGTSGNC